MSKELDYIADLEKENRVLKSLLYCTKRSCNNCGKVNCENFQRQRIDCCGLWVSYKDYIKELEEENNKIFDAINNQDVKIADLEEKLKTSLDYNKSLLNALKNSCSTRLNGGLIERAEYFIKEN